MESSNLFFDRGMISQIRKITAVGVFLLLSTTLLFSQNDNQTISLDQNGQASINIADLEDCFEDIVGSPCTPSAATGDGHAIWLSNNTFPGSSTDFLFENGAEFLELANGTATITGTLYNTNNPSDKWQVELYLSDKMNWTDWNALGRSYKNEKSLAGTSYLDWSYYIMDLSTDSKLTGLSDNAGKTLILQHAPANYQYGFQVGNAANNKNAKYGFSGWFTYSWDGVNYHQGDFNLDLANCGPVDIDDCQCEGKMQNFTFTYNGTSGVDVKAFDKDGDLIQTFTNVNDGDDLTVNGFDFKGRLEAKTSIQVVGGTSYEVHTSCSEQIIGHTYGPFTVISYTDGEGNYCSGNQNTTIGNITVSVDKENFDCDDLGENTVTITSTDEDNNTCTEQITVTIVDDLSPIVTTQDVIIDLDVNGQATITENQVITSATDNCAVTEIVITQLAFDCTNIGENVVTVQAADAAGNITTTSVTVTVRDLIAPTAVAQDITVSLDANGQATISTGDIDNGSDDNCSFTTSIDKTSFDCNEVGDNTVTLTVTDASGNTSTATATVTVIEDILPVIVPANITVDLDEDGEASILPTQVYTSITDNCSVVSIEVDPLDFDCDDLGDNTVTITATDANGNVATATAIVTVRDVTPPTVVTKNINVGLNASGTVTIAPEDVIRFNCGGGGGVSVPEPVPGAGSAVEFFAPNCTSDNCGIASYTVSQTTFDCNDAGQNIVTVTVTDGSGNVTTETAIVNVIDTTKPKVKAKNVTVELDENGIATITTTDVDDNSSDSCGAVTLTLSKTTFNCEDIGNNQVTLIGTDANGNTDTDNATVTVVDNTAPVVVTQDITVSLNMYGQATIDPKDLLIICDDAVIEEDNGGGGGGFVPGAGVTAVAFDNNLPAPPTCTKDNCKITAIMASIEQFDCNHIGTNLVTITVTDGQGNSTTATATVTVVDPIAPTAVAQDIFVDLDANGQATIDADDIDNGSDDNCNFTKSIDKTDFDCSDVGPSQVVTLTVTDQAGNTAVATANVTVRDLIAPTAVAQDITVSLDANGQATISTGDIDNGSDDNCSFTTSIDKTSFDCNEVGDNTVTLTVTDASGNTSTATATVTVIEDILPVIVPANITVDLDEDGEASILPTQVYTSITDNCSVVSIEVDPLDFDCDDLGDNTVTVTATDANGNVATATAIVTVRDVTPPTVVTKNINVGLNASGTVTIAPEDVIRFNCGGGGGVSVPEPVPGAGSAVEFFAPNCTSDNCGIASYTVSQTTFDCNDAGQNIVTVTVTDGSGNVTTETAIVNVIDTTKPKVKAKNVTVELDENGIATITTTDVDEYMH